MWILIRVLHQKPADLDLQCFKKEYICIQQKKGFNVPRHEKTSIREFVNKKGADQPADLHSLISAFVIHSLKSIISRLAMS